ncbi:MerR family transcriptional regulator [Streptomyces sp. NPDC048504]|uniref:helix-turn-helix domain-containing protein n=1 Tax=Streptomyces sp. NPDC048504 TaxID=3365559 RepID=UPI00372498AB
MNEPELYSIGDVARRTGLSVSAVRFYADEGVVAPTGLTEGGSRQYDVHAIVRLELVRTLRDLGAGKATGLKLLTRYQSLVATVNGTPKPDADRAAAVREWMTDGVRGTVGYAGWTWCVNAIQPRTS